MTPLPPSRAETARGNDHLAPRSTPAARIRRWQPFRAGSLRGYLDVELPSGLILRGARLMVGPKGGRWIAPPSVMRRDADGQPAKSQDGKTIWDQLVDFRDRAARDRFNELVLAALAEFDPEGERVR
jgi:hypothetical protein